MKISVTFFILLLLFFGLACSNLNDEKSPSLVGPINPNGDSELALLMREMFEDGMRMKQQIEKGKHPEVLKKFEKIHTAQATEPEKAASEKFKIFANSYQATLEALKNAPAGESSQIFHEMVESCMTCHRSMCPGPMVRIKKLYLEEE